MRRIAALSVLIVGCAVQPPTPLVDTRREVAGSYDAVWSGLIATLALDGLTITAVEKASGLLVAAGEPPETRSRWVECPMTGFGRWQPGGMRATYTVQVVRGDDPATQVVDLTLRLAAGGDPVTCPSTGVLENRFYTNLKSQVR